MQRVSKTTLKKTNSKLSVYVYIYRSLFTVINRSHKCKFIPISKYYIWAITHLRALSSEGGLNTQFDFDFDYS